MPPFDLRRQSPPRQGVEEIIRRATEKAEEPGKEPRIRCPLCEWVPEAGSQWFCAPCGAPEHFTGGCGTAWNTFDTRGECPGCRYTWTWTACLHCGQWSLHDDWYEKS
jgi:hypothetical protein